MLDSLRMYHVQILGLISTVVAVLIIEMFVRYGWKKIENRKEYKDVKKYKFLIGIFRNIIILLALIGFGWSAINMAGQNEIPRKILDRSELKHQINN